MICNYCESQISNNSTVCPVCGKPIETYADPAYQEVPTRTRKADSKNFLIIILGTVIAVLTILILIFVFFILGNKMNGNSNNTQNGFNSVQISETSPSPTVSSADTPTPTPQVIIVTQEPQYIYITPEPEVDNSVKYRMFVVNCDEWISLRTSPSTSSTRITTIPLGESVGFISSASNGFYKVEYNGRIGYALSRYLSSTYSSNNTNNANRNNYMTVVNCDEWISLRTSPSTAAARITTIPLGASVQYISTASNGFYRVRYNGQTGYALSKYLR